MCALIENKEMTQSYLKDSMCPIDYTQPYFDPIAAHWHRSIWNEYVWLRQKANCMN